MVNAMKLARLLAVLFLPAMAACASADTKSIGSESISNSKEQFTADAAPAPDPAFCANDRYCVCCTGGTAGGVMPPYFWSYPGDCRAAGYIIRPELSKDLCFD